MGLATVAFIQAQVGAYADGVFDGQDPALIAESWPAHQLQPMMYCFVLSSVWGRVSLLPVKMGLERIGMALIVIDKQPGDKGIYVKS